MAITYRRIFRPFVFLSSELFCNSVSGGKVGKLFKFCVLFPPMIGFFFLFWYGCVGGCVGGAVSGGWELHFVCCINRRELILWLVGAREIFFGLVGRREIYSFGLVGRREFCFWLVCRREGRRENFVWDCNRCCTITITITITTCCFSYWQQQWQQRRYDSQLLLFVCLFLSGLQMREGYETNNEEKRNFNL